MLEVIGSDQLQLCAGHEKGGCEAAVHALMQVFQSSSANAIYLINAKTCLTQIIAKSPSEI